MSLSLERAGGMGGVPPIASRDINAWARARCIALTPWEIETIRAVDLAAVAVMTKQQPAKP